MWGFNPVWLMRWHIRNVAWWPGIDRVWTCGCLFIRSSNWKARTWRRCKCGERTRLHPPIGSHLKCGSCVCRQAAWRGAARRRQQRAYSSVDWAPQAETCQFRASVSWDRLGLLSYNPPPTLPLSSAQKVFLPPRAIVFLGKVWKLGLERWAHMTFFN